MRSGAGDDGAKWCPAVATVLIIDDDPDMRDILVAVLEAEGHAVIAVAGGREALATAAERHIDMVVTDILMPDMEGIEIIRALRKANRGTNIVAISAAEQYLDMASDFGADEVIAKPLKVSDFRGVVARVLGTR
jgi:CheY-like chemotaxis protein